MVVRGSRDVPYSPAAVEPSSVPYNSYIAGTGIIESGSEDIKIATSQSGVVAKIFADTGEEVDKGEPLFQLDTRAAEAELKVKRTDADVATARVAEAVANLQDKKNLLTLAESIQDKRAISQQELDSRRYGVIVAEAGVATARAGLRKALADVATAETDLELLTVNSPVTGKVLQSNIDVGEYAKADVLADPLMIVGSDKDLLVLVDIDENDAWRYKPGAPATGVLRGNPKVKIPLKFVQLEPYVIPKQSLTGEASERVDTRVLQVIYSFERENYPVYVGQQLDVWIEVPES